MINGVVLVGKIKDVVKVNEYQKKIYLEVDRPFKDTYDRLSDVFEVIAWESVFDKILKYSNKGDLLGVEGRLQVENDSKYLIMGEKIILLNKSKDNIYKKD